jgi:hypothetical protein
VGNELDHHSSGDVTEECDPPANPGRDRIIMYAS